jgi:hypothetical protein
MIVKSVPCAPVSGGRSVSVCPDRRSRRPRVELARSAVCLGPDLALLVRFDGSEAVSREYGAAEIRATLGEYKLLKCLTAYKNM